MIISATATATELFGVSVFSDTVLVEETTDLLVVSVDAGVENIDAVASVLVTISGINCIRSIDFSGLVMVVVEVVDDTPVVLEVVLSSAKLRVEYCFNVSKDILFNPDDPVEAVVRAVINPLDMNFLLNS